MPSPGEKVSFAFYARTIFTSTKKYANDLFIFFIYFCIIFQARCSQIQSEIDRYIDSYIRALEDHRRTLQMQVAKARESKLQALRNHQEEAERRTKGASHALRFGEELLAEGSEVEVN